ncbi:phospholipase [Phytohabitans houttuyneae]|uniref:Phospholipase n=1 Tax=Phytohabitans houttuyneae TaxID=1076126 RepID=A0A6V8KMG2_9ACTN|nr:phospholipase [Phytohabitans houttuyneae]GFJ82907.1 hypothetical protein Phou_070870 [Phytohabitans houttuyneae]
MTDDRAAYRALEDQIVARYGEARYAEAADLARTAIPHLPARRSDLAHLAACALALGGRPAEALAELRAAYEAGGWWHRRILTEDPDLAALAALPGFDDLVEDAHARATAPAAAGRPPLVHRPTGPARGVLVALHGAGEDADDAVAAWGAAVDAGFVLLAPDSSQRNTPAYRSWPDPTVGLADIAAALAALPHADRDLPQVAAGFSAGARQAILWALAAHPGRPRAFVAVAPAITTDHLDQDQVTAAAARGLSGTAIVGAADDDVRDGALPALEELRRAGVRCAIDVPAGLGHTFPPDFPARLSRTLAG